MRLVDERVTDYRSVEDSGEVQIEPDVTCLVGKNESGKTALLQATYKLNPAETAKTFNEVIDFPSRHSRRLTSRPDAAFPAITATFELSDAELASIEEDLGTGVLPARRFTVTAGYRMPSPRSYQVAVDESAAVRHLTKNLDVTQAAATNVSVAGTIAELIQVLANLSEPTSAANALLGRLQGWRGHSLELHVVDAYLEPRLPRFVYFEDYDHMPGKVSIPHLIAQRDSGELSRGEQALISLLRMVDVRPEDFLESQDHERLIRRLENASNSITDEVFEYWSQNRDLEVDLMVLAAPEPAAPAHLAAGPILQVRVRNRRHRVTVPFDERSRGFVWFFSFLAYFSQLEADADRDLVLLLDEPGLSLHGKAQGDLLRFIDARLAPRHQVLFTTHSPFLIAPGALERVRTVIDVGEGGTKVSADLFKADEDTLFPLFAAMGIELAQTLFVGENILLLEGPSDLIYLEVLTEALQAAGREGLDPRWVKAPVGGAGKLSTFATLFGANKLNVAVLADSSTTDTSALRRLRDNGQLAARALVEISEATGTRDADIEDLFAADFYLDLVNAAYREELPAPITPADLDPRDPRIVRRVEKHFKDRQIDGGRLNHYRPAAALLKERVSLSPKIDQATLERAEQIVARINALLE